MLDIRQSRIPNDSYRHWVDKFMFYYTYTLSSILLNRLFEGKTTLVTDKFGKWLLIDMLGLRYDEVIIELDTLNEYPREFWALGKLYSYSLIDRPFIHVDFDFLTASKFDEYLLGADLVAYMNENDVARQGPYTRAIDRYFVKYISPKNIQEYFTSPRMIAYNAGILGGNRLDIFNEIWDVARYIIRKNLSKMRLDAVENPGEFSMTNVIFEQYLFACIAAERKITVSCLHDNENLLPDDDNFWLYNARLPKYKSCYFPIQHVHMVGQNKRLIDNAIDVKDLLLSLAPEQFYHVRELILKGQI